MLCNHLVKRGGRKALMREYRIIKKKRAEKYNRSPVIKGIRTSTIWHTVLLPLLAINRKASGQTLTIVGDKRLKTNKPIIYACTHIGFYDIMMAFEAIKTPCWLFLGDPDSVLNTFYGWLVERNGVVYVDAYDRDDRKLSKNISVQLLKQNGNLMIYPEGAWNVTDNLVVMKLFRGTVEMALETGAEIVPIAIEQYGKDFYVNIGRNISYEKANGDAQKLTDELRDTLCTLKWKIWEKFSVCKRKEIDEDFGLHFASDILEEAGPYYTMKMVEDERYHDKHVKSHDEVFSFIGNLVPRRENAFLFRDNMKNM